VSNFATQFKKGKTGNPLKIGLGRPKGSLSAKAQAFVVAECLIKKGFDPISAMIEIARNENHPISVRQKATKDLLDKVCPSLRAIEHKIEDSQFESLQDLRKQMSGLIIDQKSDY
jgi:hypothetical protein